jgi:hypothetical protein
MTSSTSPTTTSSGIGEASTFLGSSSWQTVFDAVIASLDKDKDGNLMMRQNFANIAATVVRAAADSLDTEWDGYVCISYLHTIAADLDSYVDAAIAEKSTAAGMTTFEEGVPIDGTCCPGSI